MLKIIAGHEDVASYEGLAEALPLAEPDEADLLALECAAEATFGVVQERLERLDVELAEHGHADEVAVRRHRRSVKALVAQVRENAQRGEVA